jgi:hypothetical protein
MMRMSASNVRLAPERKGGPPVTPPPVVEILRPDELRRRRVELLARAGMTADELRAGADDYTLSADLTVMADELDEIDFLLGE